LLFPLYYQAIEAQRPDAVIKDEKAVNLIKRLSSKEYICNDSDWLRQTPMSDANKVLRVRLTCQVDHYTQDFMNRHLQL